MEKPRLKPWLFSHRLHGIPGASTLKTTDLRSVTLKWCQRDVLVVCIVTSLLCKFALVAHRIEDLKSLASIDYLIRGHFTPWYKGQRLIQTVIRHNIKDCLHLLSIYPTSLCTMPIILRHMLKLEMSVRWYYIGRNTGAFLDILSAQLCQD